MKGWCYIKPNIIFIKKYANTTARVESNHIHASVKFRIGNTRTI